MNTNTLTRYTISDDRINCPHEYHVSTGLVHTKAGREVDKSSKQAISRIRCARCYGHFPGRLLECIHASLHPSGSQIGPGGVHCGGRTDCSEWRSSGFSITRTDTPGKGRMPIQGPLRVQSIPSPWWVSGIRRCERRNRRFHP